MISASETSAFEKDLEHIEEFLKRQLNIKGAESDDEVILLKPKVNTNEKHPLKQVGSNPKQVPTKKKYSMARCENSQDDDSNEELKYNYGCEFDGVITSQTRMVCPENSIN